MNGENNYSLDMALLKVREEKRKKKDALRAGRHPVRGLDPGVQGVRDHARGWEFHAHTCHQGHRVLPAHPPGRRGLWGCRHLAKDASGNT